MPENMNVMKIVPVEIEYLDASLESINSIFKSDPEVSKFAEV